MLIIAVLSFAAAIREAVAMNFVPQLAGPPAVMIAWLAVVLLALTGRRRAAAAIASVPLALALVVLLTLIMQRTGAWSGGLPGFLYTVGLAPVLASLAACSLAFSAGPRRGLAIVGRRRACLMITGLSVGFGFSSVVSLLSPSAQLPAPVVSVLGFSVAAVAVAVTCVRGTAGGRVAVLVVTGLLPGLARIFPFAGDRTADVMVLLGNFLFAVLVWAVAIASWKAQGRRTSRAAAR